MKSAWIFVALTACGRLSFDPLPTDNDLDATADAAAPTDLLVHFAFDAGTFLDDTGTGNDASCTSCPTPVTGIAGGGASFDGVTNCLSVPAAGLMPPVFTYAIWEKAADKRAATIFGRPENGAASSADSFEIYTIDNVSTSLYLIAADTTLEFQRIVGDWHHVAGVFDGSKFTVYLDGTEQTSASMVGPQPWANDALGIGCDINFGAEGNYYRGVIDDARLYSRALSPAEIAQLAMP